jgi:very-short-patch-repair endonuclease
VGVTRIQLRGAAYARLRSGIYRWVGLPESPELHLRAVAKGLPAGAAFSGKTALWLHGLDVPPCAPIEVTIRFGGRRRAGASVRRAALVPGEIVMRRGVPTTTAIRTVLGLCGNQSLTEAVVDADMALHARLISMADLQAFVAEHRNAKGIARLRRVIALAEPKTESAMETRLRMLLLLAGLPRPEVQGSIRDEEGCYLGRPDLLYRTQHLAIEYDGGSHRDRMVDDNRRQNGLVGASFRLLRFTAPDVYGTPERVVMDVRHALAVTDLVLNGRIPGGG